jgi:hypothetical protein
MLEKLWRELDRGLTDLLAADYERDLDGGLLFKGSESIGELLSLGRAFSIMFLALVVSLELYKYVKISNWLGSSPYIRFISNLWSFEARIIRHFARRAREETRGKSSRW